MDASNTNVNVGGVKIWGGLVMLFSGRRNLTYGFALRFLLFLEKNILNLESYFAGPESVKLLT